MQDNRGGVKMAQNNKFNLIILMLSAIMLILPSFVMLDFKFSLSSVYADSDQSCDKKPEDEDNPGSPRRSSGDPTFVQLSRRTTTSVNYDKPKLEFSKNSSYQVLISYEKSLITTSPEVQVVSTPPSWLAISGNTNAVDLGDVNLGFVEMTFAIADGVTPNSSTEVKLNLVDVGSQEIKATKTLKLTVDRNLFAQISIPIQGSLIRGNVPIFGLAYGENFSSYTIEYGAGYEPTVWTTVTTSATPKTNDTSPIEFTEANLTIYGNLATWETGLTEYDYPYYQWSVDLNGIYTLRLKVTNAGGQAVTDEVIVQVGRAMGSTYSGTAISPNGNALLFVQEQSIKDDFEVIGIEPISSNTVSIDSGLRLIGQMYELQPPGLEFTKDATLEFHYTDTDLGTGDETKLGIYTYNPTTGHWDYISSSIDAANNKVTAIVRKITSSYAYYAILEKTSIPNKPILTQPTSPTQNKLIPVSGTSDRSVDIEIFVNGISNATGTSTNTGTFTIQNVILNTGINTVTAKAKDQYNQVSLESDPVTVEVVEPQITVTSLKFKTSDYSADFIGTVDLGSNLYLQLSGSDPDPATKDKTSVYLTSSITDPQGIEIQLTETDISTGIYRAQAKVGINSSQATSTIAAYQDAEIITAKSKIDITKTDTVLFSDDTPPKAPSITSSTHPSVCQDTFEDGFNQWSNRDGEVGATLYLNNTQTPDYTNCLELVNIEYGGNFASNVRTNLFDASQYHLVAFDYKIKDDTRINFLVKLENDGNWYDIIFTDTAKNYWQMNMEQIGTVAGIIKDNAWHHATFNLYEMLKTKVNNFRVKEMIMADWDTAGFMKLVYGTNPAYATYYIDNFMITNYGSTNKNPQFNISVPNDPSGIAGYSFILDQTPNTIPDDVIDGSGSIVNYTNISDGIWYFHVRAKDNANNISQTNHYKLVIDTQGPTCDNPTPIPYSNSGNPNLTIHLTDNQGAGVDPGSIRLRVEGIEYTINNPALSYDKQSETLTFTPLEVGIIWPNGQVINVELTQANDYLGNALQNPISWQWTLDYSLDVTPPDAPIIISPATSNLTYNKITFMWESKDANGIADYSFILDQNSATVPDDVGEGLITSKIYDLNLGTYYFHVKAKDRPGNWSTTTHYQITISQATSLLINDFNDGSDPNEVGGWSGTWDSGNASCQPSYYNTDLNNVYGQTGYSLQVNYNVTQSGSYSGYWTATYIDLSNYKFLTFWIKGSLGGEKLKVGLKDTFWNETKVSIDDYLSSGVTTSWQKVIIPLTAFRNITAWTSMDNISITFENSLGAPLSGTVYIDEFRFEKVADTIMVSTFNTAGDRNALGDELRSFTSGTATISVGYDANNSYNNSAYGYNITYSGVIVPNGNYAGWKTYLNNLDASGFNSLSFYIKGSVGNEKPNIYFGYGELSSYDKKYVDIERYVAVTTAWQRVNIPLSDFVSQGVDISKLIELQFVFEWENTAGTIYLDDIHFANVQFPDAPVVDPITNLTNQNELTITGKVNPYQEVIPVVEIIGLGRWEQTHVFADANGNFIATVYIYGDGPKQIYVYTKDAEGNISLNSSVQTVILDRISPQTPTVDAITSPTQNPNITVSGSAETGTDVYIKITQPNSQLVEYILEATYSTYSKNITLSGGDGTYQITVVSEDDAGNWSAESAPVYVVLDAINSAPLVTLFSPQGKEIISSDTFNILWQASDSDPTDTITNITIQNTDSTKQALVDNFNDGDYFNSLNANSGPWNGDGATIETIFNNNPTVVYDGSGISLQLNYNVTLQPTSYAGFWTGLYTQPNMSAYAYVSFLVKGAVGGELFEVGLKDSTYTETKRLITNYLSKGVTTEWQRATIPLADFANVNVASLDNFSINFTNSIGSGQGTIYLDEIRFIRWQDLVTNQPNDGIYCLKTIGLLQSDRYLIKVIATDSRGGIGKAESSDYFTLANNLANGKTASASSEENQDYSVSKAIDGNLNTRWSSLHSDPQWYQIDLGQGQPINRVILRWETAYGKSYQIQVSNDAVNWTDVYTTTTGDGGVDDISFTATSARYIRLYGTERGTIWGYSLYEFEVYYDSHYANVVASSFEGAGLEPQKAFDGDLNTRWSSNFTDNEWIYLDFGIPKAFNTVILNWDNAYATSYELQTSNDAINWASIYSTTNGDGRADVIYVGNQTSKYLKINCTQRSGSLGYSLWEINVLTTTATSSSFEAAGFEADKAIDGNILTRWSSQHLDPQWLQLDFGVTQTISKVILKWEAAYGKSYKMQSSYDATNWEDIYSTTSGDGDIDQINFAPTNTRYLRMYGTERGTQWGYSLWELEVSYE